MGLDAYCKACQLERYKQRRDEQPEEFLLARRKKNLKALYNLTLEEVEDMAAAQEGRCAICREPLPDVPSVDHNHATGAVRGLLCRCCNSGLGMFRDSEAFLASAAEYLRAYQ